MDVHRRSAATGKAIVPSGKFAADEQALKPQEGQGQQPSSPRPSDALPLPLYLTNGLFFTLFFSVMYFLLTRWREKIRNSTPLHVVTLSELAALVLLITSFIYLLGFFGIDFVQSLIYKPNNEVWEIDDEILLEEDSRKGDCTSLGCAVPPPSSTKMVPLVPQQPSKMAMTITENPAPLITPQDSGEDEDIIKAVVSGKTPSYSLESKLGDCKRAAVIRREALQRITGKSLDGLPLEGFDYASILGQCCEMAIGYVQLPVGIAGPLLLDGREYMVPMATTEGCLVASTNRGCKAILACGGATSMLLRDGMTRAPVVRFATAKRAAELKFYIEDPLNFETISMTFNK